MMKSIIHYKVSFVSRGGLVDLIPSVNDETVKKSMKGLWYNPSIDDVFVRLADYQELESRLNVIDASGSQEWFDTIKQSPRQATVSDVEDLCEKIELLRCALERIKSFPVGEFRPLEDECSIWRIANDALRGSSSKPSEKT